MQMTMHSLPHCIPLRAPTGCTSTLAGATSAAYCRCPSGQNRRQSSVARAWASQPC